jgi:hypothetical protein
VIKEVEGCDFGKTELFVAEFSREGGWNRVQYLTFEERFGGAEEAKLLEVGNVFAVGFGDLCRGVGANMDGIRAGGDRRVKIDSSIAEVGGLRCDKGVVTADAIAATGGDRHGFGGEFAVEQG